MLILRPKNTDLVLFLADNEAYGRDFKENPCRNNACLVQRCNFSRETAQGLCKGIMQLVTAKGKVKKRKAQNSSAGIKHQK